MFLNLKSENNQFGKTVFRRLNVAGVMILVYGLKRAFKELLIFLVYYNIICGLVLDRHETKPPSPFLFNGFVTFCNAGTDPSCRPVFLNRRDLEH